MKEQLEKKANKLWNKYEDAPRFWDKYQQVIEKSQKRRERRETRKKVLFFLKAVKVIRFKWSLLPYYIYLLKKRIEVVTIRSKSIEELASAKT